MRTWIFLLFPIFLIGYDFKPLFISAFAGYQHDSTSFSFKDKSFPTRRFIQEKLSDQNIPIFGLSAEYFRQRSPYLSFSFLYGLPNSNDTKTKMTVRAQNSTGSIVQDFEGEIFHKLRGHFYDLEAKLGYPLRWGPLTFVPEVGLFYEDQELKRRDVTPHTFFDTNNSSIISGMFYPKKTIRTTFLLPEVGVKISFEPTPFSRILLNLGYDFRFGWMDTSSKYFIETLVEDMPNMTTTFRQYTNSLSENRTSWAHIFHFESIIGLPEDLALNFLFDYEYMRANRGSDKVTARKRGVQVAKNGSEVSRPIHTFKKISYNGYSRQIFRGRIKLSYQF